MRDHRGVVSVTNRRNVAEKLYRLRSGAVGQRSVGDLIDRRSRLNRRLGHDVVVDAVDRIEPVVRRDERVTAQRREQSRRDLLLGYSQLERFGSIDLDLERRVVERFRNPHIVDARNQRHLRGETRGDVVVGVEIVAVDLSVDRRRQPEVQHLVHDVGGHEVAFDVRKLCRHHFADAILVDGGRMMIGLELDQDFAVLRAYVVAREKRDRIRLRQIDVVAYLLQLVGGDYLPDRSLDIVDNHRESARSAFRSARARGIS